MSEDDTDAFERSRMEQELLEKKDEKYAEFQRKLIPTVVPESIIGIRTPDLKKYAKELIKAQRAESFTKELPHRYFEENQIHAFVISEEKNFDQCISDLEKFLPYVDNWATADQMSPRIFTKNKDILFPYIEKWILSDQTYTVRFAVGILMQHFLDDDYDTKYPEMVSHIRSQEYYINMMVAWYFATALAKQYETIIPYIEQNRLDVWTHNKVIQKARESYRITPVQKEYLNTYKRKKQV